MSLWTLTSLAETRETFSLPDLRPILSPITLYIVSRFRSSDTFQSCDDENSSSRLKDKERGSEAERKEIRSRLDTDENKSED